ncbi:hypothetical protein Purlil1_6913 [Purpureocillium lilacinum]|uniref:F-box domain-containing protein n=1 Tax=Purpureocillium lilacinum TaxID=33203 RepID=A0ABR0BXG5_PURLI|nr:hypothetical protein Purlil1_6913 [Purpureocillium lilacinum]
MASLTQLPWEILLEIKSYCTDNDLRSLCFASKTFTKWLQPVLYATVTLTAKPSCGRRLRAIASGPRAEFVRRIVYEPRYWYPVSPKDYGHDWIPLPMDDEDRPVDADNPLAEDTCLALKSLHLFSNLESFFFRALHYPIIEPPKESGGCADDYAKHMLPSIARLDASLGALSHSAGAFTGLAIHGLPVWADNTTLPYPSIQGSSKWTALLEGLTSLDVALYDPADCYCLFHLHRGMDLGFVCSHLLGHLLNVEHLRLAGRECQQLLTVYQPIPWANLRMPHLKSLYLDYALIDGELCSFIVAHAKTLEEMHLPSCNTGCTRSWVLFFAAVLGVKPPRLVIFDVIPAALDYPSRNQRAREYCATWVNENGALGEMKEEEYENGIEDDFIKELAAEVQALTKKNRDARQSHT